MNIKNGIAFFLVFTTFILSVYAGGSGEQTTGTNNNTTSTQTGGNVPATATAADLVQALGGASKARANGNTVTITEKLWIEKDLTIPTGITLELTEEWGIWFHDMTLTVNGTINARGGGNYGSGNSWIDGGINFDDGTTIINGNGTINLTSRGNLFNINGENGRKLILDGVTLVGIADNDNSLINVNNGGELVLVSGTIRGNICTSDGYGSSGGVSVYKATFTMNGGEISGNSSNCTGNRADSNGGGVAVSEGSLFTMNGGIISGNSVTSIVYNPSGGGLAIWSSTFTMNGGEISDNIAGKRGGGVFLADSTFTMSGGTISGNTAITGVGGGVYMFETNFTMEGGTIYGSKADGGNANTSSDGSTVAIISDVGPFPTKWGTGGTYTRGGVAQTGGSNITSTNETLIAIPAR